MNNEQKYEFSRVISLEEPALNQKSEVLAEKIELENLAKRFGVHDVGSLKLEYIITKKEDIEGAFVLIARLISRVTKFAIEDFSETCQIDEKFDVVLIGEDSARENMEQLNDFDIEIIEDNNEIDIGEIAAQYLSLCIYM